MNEIRKHRMFLKAIAAVSVAAVFLSLTTRDMAYAAESDYSVTAEPAKDPGSGQDANKSPKDTDLTYIVKQAGGTGQITLEPGKTYKLKSAMHVKSNFTLDATGATIVCSSAAAIQADYNSHYASFSNVTFKGGTWTSEPLSGVTTSSFKFAHASNIRFINMDIKCTNADYHAIELVACKDVTISGCTITSIGSSLVSKPTRKNELLQIDIATKATAPFLGGKLADGSTCKNITVKNCTISGEWAVGIGWDYKKTGYLNRAHDNITFKNCKLISSSREGIKAENCKSLKIIGCEIVSKYSNKESDYSVGLTFGLEGNIKGAKLMVVNSTIKGGKFGILTYSTAAEIRNVRLRKSKVYSKRGQEKAVAVWSAIRSSEKDVQKYEW